jgi:hypothetical protein
MRPLFVVFNNQAALFPRDYQHKETTTTAVGISKVVTWYAM